MDVMRCEICGNEEGNRRLRVQEKEDEPRGVWHRQRMRE